jgi:hypothetical protein
MSCKCDLGTGLNMCHCAGCHRTFTSISAFDMHQRIAGRPEVCVSIRRRCIGKTVTPSSLSAGRRRTVSRYGGKHDPRGPRHGVGAEI